MVFLRRGDNVFRDFALAVSGYIVRLFQYHWRALRHTSGNGIFLVINRAPVFVSAVPKVALGEELGDCGSSCTRRPHCGSRHLGSELGCSIWFGISLML